MAGDVEHMNIVVSELEGVTLPYKVVDAWNSRCVVTRTDDRTVPGCLQFFIASGVIEVMVSVHDMREFPAGFSQGCIDRSDFRGVNGGSHTSIGIVNEITVVV